MSQVLSIILVVLVQIGGVILGLAILARWGIKLKEGNE